MKKEITIRGATLEEARKIISDIQASIVQEGDKVKIYLADGQTATYTFTSKWEYGLSAEITQ